MKNLENKILTIIHDGRIRVDGGIRGYYKSLNNIIRDKIIYKEIYTEKTALCRVYADPIYKIIADKEKIMKQIELIDIEALKLMNQKCKYNSNFYKIIFTDGFTISVLADKLSDEIKNTIDYLFENNEFIGDSSEKYLDYPPILDYTQKDYSKKIYQLKQISNFIIQKNKKDFYDYLQLDCEINIKKTNRKIIGVKEFKKYVTSITGVFNHNIPYFTEASFYGFINYSNESDILLKVSYYQRNKKLRFEKYLVFEFKYYKIAKIDVFEIEDLTAKKLNDVAINFIKSNEYNDLNDDISNKIKNDNKTYEEILENLFPSRGTTTYFKDILKK